MKTFTIKRRADKYSRRASYAVHGFWSGEDVTVDQSRNYTDGNWREARIGWSCGGRDPEKEPDETVAALCFGKAIISAAKLARKWNRENE